MPPEWKERRRTPVQHESGAVALVTALCLTIFMALLALVLDIGHLLNVRGELQNAADASALAGAQAFLPADSSAIVAAFDPNCSAAISTASQFGNVVDSQTLTTPSGDISIGHWGWPGDKDIYALNEFVPLGSCETMEVNAIRVFARRDRSVNGPVATWFAAVLGIGLVDVTSRPAVAALGYLKSADAGRIFPIAVRKSWLASLGNPPVGEANFTPDTKDNSGWCSPPNFNPSAAQLKSWITNGYPESLTFGNTVDLNNGQVNSAVQDLASELPKHSQVVEGTGYTGWLVVVPVVNKDQMVGSTPVVAWQTAVIRKADPKGSPKSISVAFINKPVLVRGGSPGGPRSTVYAASPILVQ